MTDFDFLKREIEDTDICTLCFAIEYLRHCCSFEEDLLKKVNLPCIEITADGAQSAIRDVANLLCFVRECKECKK